MSMLSSWRCNCSKIKKAIDFMSMLWVTVNYLFCIVCKCQDGAKTTNLFESSNTSFLILWQIIV
jgi:hypothetical protein